MTRKLRKRRLARIRYFEKYVRARRQGKVPVQKSTTLKPSPTVTVNSEEAARCFDQRIKVEVNKKNHIGTMTILSVFICFASWRFIPAGTEENMLRVLHFMTTFATVVAVICWLLTRQKVMAWVKSFHNEIDCCKQGVEQSAD